MTDFPVQFEEGATKVELCLDAGGTRLGGEKWIIKPFTHPAEVLQYYCEEQMCKKCAKKLNSKDHSTEHDYLFCRY